MITKLESLISQEKQTAHERDLKPLSLNEFHDMIDQTKRDSDNGRVISHQELKEKVKTWKKENLITIASVFDCRQKPTKIKKI